MLRNLLGTFVLFAALFALVIAPAQATVTFDPTTGTGFVGKGDVQLAFGWNNAQLQANADYVSFTSNAAEDYEATCTWVTGEGTRGEKTHNVKHTESTTVYSTVSRELRKNSQGSVTGFNLGGFGSTTESGEVPVVGEACQGEGLDATWTAVTLVRSSGGLYVNYGDQSILLPITPAV